MKTNEELLRKEEEDISKTIALSLEEYHAAQRKKSEKDDYLPEDENDEMLQEAIRLSIIGCKKSEKEESVETNDSYRDIVKKNFNKITYYLCNSHASTKNQNDVIDNKLFWEEIYKNYKNIYIIIRDYMISINRRNEKMNEESTDSTSSREYYDSDDSSDCSNNSSSLSCCSLEQIKRSYKNINYTTKDYCKWLRKGNRSKCLNDHVYVNYLLKEMKLLDDTASIHNLVFGVNNYKYSNKMDIKKWCNHSISFYDSKQITFGLRQFLSGPCGLISSIQGYIIIILLFNYKYHFLWDNNYFNILKTNADFLNFTNSNSTGVCGNASSPGQVNRGEGDYDKPREDHTGECNQSIIPPCDEHAAGETEPATPNEEEQTNSSSQRIDYQTKRDSTTVGSEKNGVGHSKGGSWGMSSSGERVSGSLDSTRSNANNNGNDGVGDGGGRDTWKGDTQKESARKGEVGKDHKDEDDDYDHEFVQLVRDNIKDLKYYSLVESMAYIMYQCTDKSYYVIAFLLPECYDFSYYMNRRNSDEDMIRDLKKINIYYKEFTSIKDVIKFYLEHFIIFSSSTGAISFLYSVILTRGMNNIMNDMDDVNHPLIGIYGHCSQELVNLLLTGRACSNVFDNNSIINTFPQVYEDMSGTFQFDGGGRRGSNSSSNLGGTFGGILPGSTSIPPFASPTSDARQGSQNCNGSEGSSLLSQGMNKNNIILKGINKRPLIGLLTDFEAFKYCEVGSFYKYPIYPIWVISSSNHYTVLFSLNIKNSKCTSEELFLTKMNKVWNKYDKENNKYILSHLIPQFIQDLNLKEEYKNMFDGFVSDLDILLYSEFKAFYLQLKQNDINKLKNSDPPKEKYFYLYDAQETPEKCINYFLLKEVDYDVTHDNHLKFFNTRWPNNTVEILNNAKRPSKHKYPY
ncbi:conserved Plasmodium protein, unknown function [Plasmodium knowlesi strain H]|uniref:Deubiquitinating enzyme MINDY-3/4 conserved domain-containing protein n=3 Tax=Plasmodium knowlesi TaxID=5850 RepID=A0A5K1UBL8_PLAKH|nr:conserved protein, unknown function [Plasmodium knowlesi strain H]OTN64317.1 Uncharacterized protein PKNOH_S130185100 [Plasmodium knowlesi]CAA9989017.1 conserved protein, unknown function [Plasmodium knowlesi strain H]SBO24861.1 conserved Plasmodium protein, unknown function [Plasmodium knowlesi strain H]SBO27559.1 conserved Plasmodium protein, unknown function [Plasmodium knowlesi strain H]VVS78491.1 conserved protein, unknown function [Plasmodium knowlesi strain H]|eukprot:XP_002261365.1 hypothetical protein, conserved in Plasmodium species [Plasmodium knowlesi strain H]